ncbi:TPA: DUF4435 domain-containing protein, partial [Salmonella enterica]
MFDFEDFFLNEEYLEPYCAMIGKKGLVFVEGLKDIPFWEGMLDDGSVLKYSVNYASHEGTRGKTVLMKFCHLANKFALFAMDSDFDYTCPNNSENARKINSNKYIIQTLVYSKESISLHHMVLSDCIKKIKIKNEITFPIKSYFESYSNKIYEALLRFLFLKESGVEINDEEFHKKITPLIPVIDSDYNLKNDPFSLLKEKKELLESEYTDETLSENAFIEFKNASMEKGLNNNTAAYFINGHFFERSVVMPLINELIKSLKKNELDKIKEECKKNPNSIESNRNEVFKYIDNELNFNRLIHDSKIKYNTPLSMII